MSMMHHQFCGVGVSERAWPLRERRGHVIGFLALLVIAVCAKPPLAFADSPGDGFDVIHYDLAIIPEEQGQLVAGKEKIRFQITADQVRRLTFTGNALTIEEATVDGLPAKAVVSGDALSFDLPEPFPKGRIATLEVSYSGRPIRGLIVQEEILYTSYFACDWMICLQNKFSDKATFSLALQVPAGADTLAPGSIIAKRSISDGQEIHYWHEPRPYSAYLFGFAFGRFSEVRSGPFSYVSAGAEPDELMSRFAETNDIAEFLACKAGLPLPVPNYSQLLVEGFEAQEAATYSIIGRNALPSGTNIAAEDWVIVHELSHQWWGNLISAESITEFWLNEGITTFMTAAWKEHRYGAAAYEEELDVARARLEKAREAGFDKPLAWPGQYPSLAVRRAIQYSKGALFMHELRQVLGEEDFWAGLKLFSQTHAGGTVTSMDLQRAMEQASDQNLDSVFAAWVYGE